MTSAKLGVFLGLAFFGGAVSAQDRTDHLVAEALKSSPLASNLEQLTDQIGGRVPGTPAMEKAVEWGVEAFHAAGADSVHTENFTIAASWSEGATEMEVVSPETFAVRVVSLAWAPALTAHHHGPVVDLGEGTSEDYAKAGNFSGAILLVHSGEMQTWNDLFDEYLKAPGIIDRALRGNALAIAFQSTRPHDLLYRHINSQDGTIDRIPMVLVSR